MEVIEATLDKNGIPVNKALVQHKGQYYIVSESTRLGLETLIFLSDSEGKITNHTEVGGSLGIRLHEVLANFESELF